MTDSETTRRQKIQAYDDILGSIGYLRTHGLDCITLEDLRTAARALNNLDVGVKR